MTSTDGNGFWDELTEILDTKTDEGSQEKYYEYNGRPLNSEQRAVVDGIFVDAKDRKIENPRIITVSAGPGSGKTTALVNRMVKLIEKDGVDPEDIVLLTYTNKAKDEMRTRFFKMIRDKDRAKKVIFSTFHSYAAKLINAVPTVDMRVFEDAKNALCDPARKGEIVERYARKKYLMLDEAQDMKEAYSEIVRGMMKYNHGSDDDSYLQVTAVFDIDQAIFGYDGADDSLVGKLRRLDKDGEYVGKECDDAISCCFKINYRSTKEIVDFAEKYREYYYKSNNIPMERDINDKMESGFEDKVYGLKGEIQFVNCGTGDNYKDVIIDKVYDDVSDYDDELPVTVGILVPTNKDVRYIYAVLSKAFENRQDVIVEYTAAYGKDDENDNGDIDFPLDCLDEFHALLGRLYRKKNGSDKLTKEQFEEALDDLTQKYEDSKYIEGVRRFAKERESEQLAYDEKIDYKEFRIELRSTKFEEFYLDYFCNSGQDAKIKITVSTIHKAKGREFSWVYMSKIDEHKNVLGLKSNSGASPDLIKNRYVAITRAQYRLIIIDTDPGRNYMGYEAQQTDLPEYGLIHKDIFEAMNEIFVCEPYTPGDLKLSFLPKHKNFQTFIKAGSTGEKDADLETFFEDTPKIYQASKGLEFCRYKGRDGKYYDFFGAEPYKAQEMKNSDPRSINKAEVNVVMIYRSVNNDGTGVDKPSGNYKDDFEAQYPEMIGYDEPRVKRKLILPIVWYASED